MSTAVETRTEAQSPRRAFVVVGMHRSGTSAMTRTLSLLGAALPEKVMLAHDDNPSGFWEPQSVADLNDEILQALDSEWDDVFAFRPKPYLSNFDQYYVGRAVELIEREFDGSELIVLKDPRISVLTTFWDRALREAGYATHYIIMVRNPLEVAESLRARDSFPREKSLLLWSSYMIAVDRDTRDHQRTFVSYDRLMNEWRLVRDRVQTDAGVPFPRDTAAAANEVDRFLDRGLRHHHAAADDFFSRSDVADEVKALYRIFADACDGAGIDSASVEAIRVDLEKIESIVGPLMADLKGRVRALTKENIDLYEARAGENQRSESLERELAEARTECDRLNAEVEAKGSETAELLARVAAVEAERESLSAVIDKRTAEATELIRRLSSVEATSRGLRELHEAERARSERLNSELEQLSSRHEELSQDRTKLERELREAEAGVKRSAQRLVEQRRKAEGEIQSARDAVVDGQNQLSDRFRELATLSGLLQEQELRNSETREQLRWLTALDEQLRTRPRWWGFMPAPWRRAQEQEQLKMAGLFDGEAYLAAHPDVAAAGIDPLRHYVSHGIHESRRRG